MPRRRGALRRASSGIIRAAARRAECVKGHTVARIASQRLSHVFSDTDCLVRGRSNALRLAGQGQYDADARVARSLDSRVAPGDTASCSSGVNLGVGAHAHGDADPFR